jgi:hypothetical protein
MQHAGNWGHRTYLFQNSEVAVDHIPGDLISKHLAVVTRAQHPSLSSKEASTERYALYVAAEHRVSRSPKSKRTTRHVPSTALRSTQRSQPWRITALGTSAAHNTAQHVTAQHPQRAHGLHTTPSPEQTARTCIPPLGLPAQVSRLSESRSSPDALRALASCLALLASSTLVALWLPSHNLTCPSLSRDAGCVRVAAGWAARGW